VDEASMTKKTRTEVRTQHAARSHGRVIVVIQARTLLRALMRLTAGRTCEEISVQESSTVWSVRPASRFQQGQSFPCIVAALQRS
jgi:hypothetical protein